MPPNIVREPRLLGALRVFLSGLRVKIDFHAEIAEFLAENAETAKKTTGK